MKLLTVATCLFISHLGYGMQQGNLYTLPCKQVLEHRLKMKGFPELAEKTSLIANLANTKKHVWRVAEILEASLEELKNNHKDSIAYIYTKLYRHYILEALLEDHPKAIDELKSLKLMSQASFHK